MKPLHELTPVGRGRRLRGVAHQLLTAYGITSPRLAQIATASNIIFKVTDPQRSSYALRITAPKSCHGVEEIRSEVAWLHALAEETDIGCPTPIAGLEGKYVFEIDAPGENLKLCSALYQWVPGVTLDGVMTLENVRRHGQLMARLHAHAAAFDPPEGFRIRSYDSVFPYACEGFAGIEPIVLFDHGPEAPLEMAQREVFATAHRVVADELNALIQSSERQRLIHNDLHIWNVKVHGDTLYALDFEDMMWGFPLQDIATTLYYYRWQENYESLLAAFRTGYEAHQPWPAARPRQLETLIMGRMLLLANYVAVSKDSEDIALAPEYLTRVAARLCDFLET